MMKGISWGLLVSIVLTGYAISQSTQGTEKAVRALEDQWTAAQRANKSEQIAPLLADNGIFTDPDGQVTNRTQALAEEKATHYASVDIQDVHIAVFGDTAIASEIFNAKGTDSKGKPMDVHARWTDTWVKMPNGKWQCVASHGSAIAH
jgi:uncharacterized protein (TIGR02246 family)